jgi:hypothetical protein
MAELVDFPSLFSLKGKVAVVTGGSRGLGLSAASAYVFLCWVSNRQFLAQVAVN